MGNVAADLFLGLAECLTSGDIDAAAAHFEAPCAVFSGKLIAVLPEQHDIVRVLSRYRRALWDSGIARVRADSITASYMVAKGVSYDVAWQHLDARDEVQAVSLTQCYVSTSRADDYRIAMMEIRVWGNPRLGHVFPWISPPVQGFH